MQYLDTAASVSAFAAEIAKAPSIALDTEGASFHRFVDRVYLMQLSTRTATATWTCACCWEAPRRAPTTC